MDKKLTVNKFLLLACIVFSSYITKAQNSSSNQIGSSLVGMASYYPSDEDKRKTFSGDIYDMTAMEAAHKTFPIGSLIKVTNLETGKEVMLRINDRPNTSERIMDMTLAAADSLGMVKDDKAVIPVKTEIIALGLSRSSNLRQVLATSPSPTAKKEEKAKEKVVETVSVKENAKKVAQEKAEKEKQAKKEKADNLAKEKAAALAAKKEKAEKVKTEKLAKEKADKEKTAQLAKEKQEKALAAKTEKAKPLATEKPSVATKEKVTTEKPAEKIAPAAPKTTVPTDNTTTLFKDIAVYDIAGKKQKPQGFGIQTGNFTEINRAITEAKTIEGMKLGTVYIQTIATTDGKKTYAVLLGAYKAKDETKEVIKQLTEKKYAPFTKQY